MTAGPNTLLRLSFYTYRKALYPNGEKEVERLAQEGFVMISAGGETTSRVLSIAFFHIISNPRVLQRLQEEITAEMPNATILPSAKVLEELMYLVILTCCHTSFFLVTDGSA